MNNNLFTLRLKMIYIILLILMWFAGSSDTVAQSTRSLINDGVDLYKEKKFLDAETKFKKGLEKDFKTYEGHFNLGDTYYKQGRYDEALESYKNALILVDDDYKKSKIYYNIGNSLLKSKKIKESIDAYSNSLKMDPNDLEAKYNLSYALDLLKNQQNQQQNKDQNNKDQKQKQNQEQQNQDQQNQDQQNQQQQDQQQQQPQPKNQISKEEAERILEALKNNEADLQKQLRQRKAKVVKKEKDW